MKVPGTDLMILESPATFVFRVVDLSAIAILARKYNAKTYIDNTCLIPFFQKPLELGIDIVMHTMSKYIGGHSDIIGGVLVSKDEQLMRMMMGNNAGMVRRRIRTYGRMACNSGATHAPCQINGASKQL